MLSPYTRLCFLFKFNPSFRCPTKHSTFHYYLSNYLMLHTFFTISRPKFHPWRRTSSPPHHLFNFALSDYFASSFSPCPIPATTQLEPNTHLCYLLCGLYLINKYINWHTKYLTPLEISSISLPPLASHPMLFNCGNRHPPSPQLTIYQHPLMLMEITSAQQNLRFVVLL